MIRSRHGGYPAWFSCLLTSWIAMGALAAEEPKPTMNPIDRILRQDVRFAPFLKDPASYRLQVVLGLIEEQDDGSSRLVQHGYRLDAEYFYPASAVKLCAAIAAMEELTRLAESSGLAIDAATPMVYHPLFADEVLEARDPSNLAGGRITVGHEIRKLFLVSDNTAFNRLYELVGQDALHHSMQRAGLGSARIVHRLAEFRSVAQNRQMPRITFRGETFQHDVPERTSQGEIPPIPVGGVQVGQAYLRAGKRVDGPLDFRDKNRVSLLDLQRALAKVVRPDVDAGGPGFRLDETQRALLVEPLRQLPRASRNPVYDAAEHPDQRGKFLLPGLERVLPKARLEISNKIGQAYGFSTENAYVQDTATGRAFFLAAVIYTNAGGVLNDDLYEYQQVAGPFFADLGEAVARTLWGPSR